MWNGLVGRRADVCPQQSDRNQHCPTHFVPHRFCGRIILGRSSFMSMLFRCSCRSIFLSEPVAICSAHLYEANCPARDAAAAALRSIVRRRRKIRRSGLTDRSQARLRPDVYRFVVKGSAPELFPVMSLVRIWLTRCETGERRAFDWARTTCYKALKMLDILSLTNCPLN